MLWTDSEGKIAVIEATTADASKPISVIGSTVEGTISKINTQDNNQESHLNEILKQLKIMNIHLSLMTDTVVKKTEVE